MKKTPFVLLENVDRLLKSPSKQKGRDFAIMLKTFDVLGYDVQWRIINAAEYGSATKKKKSFYFCL
ncbi:DNA cytosine methyltransferase [Mycoplasmopsis felis]|nr:DNA cytosine methyltransferase [Mycoplasmopsis felis]